MAFNKNKRTNSRNTIVKPFDVTESSIANGKWQNNSLQSFPDSHGMNIPSWQYMRRSLQTSRNAEAKQNAIKPVQNHIKMLKLPTSISENWGSDAVSENDGTHEDKTKDFNKNSFESSCKNQRNTF